MFMLYETCIDLKTGKKRSERLGMWTGANAVSHLNYINVSKLYIIRQFITWKLQWYYDTNHSLQT